MKKDKQNPNITCMGSTLDSFLESEGIDLDNSELIKGFKSLVDLFEKKEITRDVFEKWLALHIQTLLVNLDCAYRDEISDRMPSIDYMSFAGPEAVMKWLFEHVDIKKEDK